MDKSLVKEADNFKDTMTRECQQYYNYCDDYKTSPDPSVIVALNNKNCGVLELTDKFCLAGLMPLSLVFKYSGLSHIHTVYFNNSFLGNTAIFALGNIINNKFVKHLKLYQNGITRSGIVNLSQILQNNSSLTTLEIQKNIMGVRGSEVLAKTLKDNTTLRHLNVSNCSCGYKGIKILKELQKIRKKKVSKKFKVSESSRSDQFMNKVHLILTGEDSNYVLEEILNAISHGLCFFFFVIPALVFLMIKASDRNDTIMRLSYLIYAGSLGLMYCSSTLLHSFFLLKRASLVLKLLDHISISVLIAGSYSPFLLNTFGHLWISCVVFVIIWSLSFFTMYLSILDKYWKTELTCYIAMGWLISIMFPFVKDQMPTTGWLYMLIGGIFYIIGVLFYVLGRRIPVFHVVWHVFVFLGSLAHYHAIYTYDERSGQNKMEELWESFLISIGANVV